MRAKLLRGFILGDVKVEPLKGRITNSEKSVAVSPEALDVLLHLASHPNEVLACDRLIDKVWGKSNGNRNTLDGALAELARAFGEDTGHPRLIEMHEGRGCHLAIPAKTIHFPANSQADPVPVSEPHLPLREILPEPAEGLKGFWQELQKRRVVRVGIGYLAIAWLIVEVADTVFPVLELPEWSMKLLILLVSFGFVLTLIITWLVQVTPEGLVLDIEQEGSQKSSFQRLAEFILLIVLLAATSIWTFRAWVQPSILAVPDEVAQTDITPEPTALEPVKMPPYERSIAVLPFVNFGSNPADQYIGAGIAEELLNKLVRVRNLKVAARTSSFHYAGLGHDIPTMANEMGVTTVLEGSFRREGDSIRVVAQLVDSEGFHLWSEEYDYEFDSLIETQNDIALQVARRTVSVVEPGTSAWLTRNETDDPAAFDAYLRGLTHLRKPRQAENLLAAQGLFEQSTHLDARFTRAWAGACETQLAWFRLTRDLGHFEEAERLCHRALTLDADSQEVYTALGNLYRTSSRYELAAGYFRNALEINAYNEEATYGLARSVQGLGDLLEAERLLRHCVELEPGYWGPYLGMGNFLFRQGRYDEAAPYYQKVTVLTPDNPDGHTNLGAAHLHAGNWEDAALAWQKSLELSPSAMAYRNMGTVYYYSGRYAEAVAMHREAVQLAPEDHWLWGKLAAAYRESGGEEENSQSAYRRAIELATSRLEVEAADALTMAYLSAYYLNVGNEPLAIQHVQNATELEPGNPEIWYFSGMVNAQLGQTELALQGIANAVDLGYSGLLLASDPQLDELSGLDEFQRLIE